MLLAIILTTFEVHPYEWDSLIDCRVPLLEWKPEWNSFTLREVQWVVLHLVNYLLEFLCDSFLMDDRMFQQFTYIQHVSAIYLYPACQSSRTSCSPTTIWSNTTSLTSLLQKTWWQRKFLCFNKEQSKEPVEPLGSPFFLVSTSFAPWSSSSPIEFPSDILPFMYKKAFISGLQSLCCFLNSFIVWLTSYLHLTCHTLRLSLFSLE